MNRIKAWEWTLLAVVVVCATVLIVEQAQAQRLLDLMWWMRDWGW